MDTVSIIVLSIAMVCTGLWIGYLIGYADRQKIIEAWTEASNSWEKSYFDALERIIYLEMRLKINES